MGNTCNCCTYESRDAKSSLEVASSPMRRDDDHIGQHECMVPSTKHSSCYVEGAKADAAHDPHRLAFYILKEEKLTPTPASNILNYVGNFDFPPNKWSKKEIECWLEVINMGEYKSAFDSNKIDGLTIFDVEDDEMTSLLGIKNSIHRKRLRKAITILSQYQKQFDNGQQKDVSMKNMIADGGLDYSSFSQSRLGSSFIKNETSFNIKNNSAWFQKTNVSTNVFHKNALRNLDSDPIIEETIIRMSASGKNMMEEEKLEAQLRRSPMKELCGSIRKTSNPQSDTKAYSHKKTTPQKDMCIEQPIGQNSDTEDESCGSGKECQGPVGKVTDWDAGANDEPLKIKDQQPSDPNSKEPGSLALIIQPVDGVQTNNFFWVSESGGRIGRHSNNEIVILEESVSRYHSKIEFQNNRFYLVDIGSTTGTFIKIEDNMQIQEGMILELGSNQFLVEAINCHNQTDGKLKLKVIEGMNVNQEFFIQNRASVGRKSTNSIAFADDFHLSHEHSRIEYIEGRFIFEDAGSTNGSWLRLSPEGQKSGPYELNENTIFKIGASSTYRVKSTLTTYLDTTSKEYDSSVNCAICYENDRNVVILPCKHNVVCLGCSKNVKNCPVCRLKITDVIRIYKS